MQVYMVGGAVRDHLLNKPIKDKDFVVVGATPEQMLAQGFIQVGADFPVFLHPTSKQEYALARTERKSGHGYKGFQIHSSPEVTLKEDLQRRDLTINALAIEVTSLFDDTPLTGEIIDFYDGLSDIKQKQLRHVSDAFLEDPLRVLRVARFYGRYYADGFQIVPDTQAVMAQIVAADELAHLSAERLWQESCRAMMQDNPEIYWQTLWEVGALHKLLPELAARWQHTAIKTQTLSTLHMSAKRQHNLAQRWTLLLQSLCLDNLLPQDLLPDPSTSSSKHHNIPLSSTHQKEDESEDNPANNSTNACHDIESILHRLKAPKQIISFVSTYAAVAPLLAQLSAQQPASNSANQPMPMTMPAQHLLTLIERSNAHKDPQRLTELSEVSSVIEDHLSIQYLHQAIATYQSVTMKDIDPTLKGAAIGTALKQKRLTTLADMNANLCQASNLLVQR